MRTRLCNLLAAGVALAALPLRAQTVADARAADPGTTVTIEGIVTSGAALGPVRYVQDATAGIAIYPGGGSVPGFAPFPGDAVTVTGTLILFNGLTEINPVLSFSITGSGNPLPEALPMDPADLGEANEGLLVRVEAVAFNAGGTFTNGTWTVQGTDGEASVYLPYGHPLIGTPVPAGVVSITGISSQFDDSAPFTSGHQLLPRSAEDIMPYGSIAVLPPVIQTDINPAGFTLHWQTNLPGSSEVAYGPTPALGNLAQAVGNATDHGVVLNGMPAASFRYARCFSVAGGDTAFSAMGLYSTASAIGGSIKAYFTHAVDPSVSSGTPAVALFSAVDDTLAAYIGRAQSSLDIALYNTDNSTVVQAVNEARDRGVQVRWITEGNSANWALDALDPAIPVLQRTNSEGSGMHDKFFIIDAEDPLHATVMSGSCNWTDQSFFDDHNNLLFLQDQALARCYRLEFEEMWGGSGPLPVASNARFGADKSDNTPHLFNVGGILVESRFSPSDGTAARIVKALDDAQDNVRITLFTFTDNNAGDALLAASQRPGMLVSGDMEDVEATGSEFPYLVSQGVDLVSHLEEPGLLHHKYAIIDEGGPDPFILTGSQNWTASAETVNDENTLLIHDAGLANQFLQEWTARHNAVTSVAARQGHAAWRAWPLPATDRLHVELPPDAPAATLQLRDALGRVVLSRKASPVLHLDGLPDGLYLLSCPEYPEWPALRVPVRQGR
jgi:phosphatidylserine/phosphatidylglycerophosphate/cardiolipin synthase-like enzyme